MGNHEIDWRREVRQRLNVSMRAERENDIVEELAQDLEQRFDDLRKRGVDEAHAYHQVLEALEDGARLSRNLARVAGQAPLDAAYAEPSGRAVIAGVVQDIRLALRTMLHDRVFALVSVLTLAFGIAANVTMFTIAYAVLWRPLPFAAPDRLVEIHETRPTGGMSTYTSIPNYADWRESTRSFEAMAAYTDTSATLTGVGDPVRLRAYEISTALLPLIGVEPLIGRNFTLDEDRQRGPGAVLLSYHVWEQRFGANPRVVGQRLTLNGEAHTVVGVMPQGFRFPERHTPIDLWLPIGRDPFPLVQLRDGRLVRVVARLREGVTVATAAAEMTALARSLAEAHPQTNAGWGATVIPVDQDWFGASRATLLLLMGAVGFVLLIVCSNLASVFLARATVRQREVAVRRALGASRWRIAQQIMAQSLVVAAIGGAVGVAISLWLRGVVIGLAPTSLPRLTNAQVDLPAIVFAIAGTLAAGVITGLAPAWMSTREAAVASARGAAGRARYNAVLRLLVVAEITAGIVLLAGAGLFTQSLMRLSSVRPGFDSSHILVVPLELPSVAYPDAERQAGFVTAVLERVESLPGVERAAAAFPLPYEGAVAFPFSLDEGARFEPLPSAYYRSVSPDYFAALGIPILRGRAFTRDDRASSAAVVVINAAMAAQYFSTVDPIGRRLTVVDRNAGDRRTSREIVGVVGEVRHLGLDRPSGPEMYVPYQQAPSMWMSLAVRGREGRTLGSRIAEEVHAVDPAMPVQDAYWLADRVSDSASAQRFSAQVLTGFALSAVLLAMIGIAGTTAYVVTQRTPEIAVRVALGASFLDVLRLILSGTLRIALAGAVLGLCASVALSRFVQGMLFEISPTDPSTLVAVALGMTLLTLLAALGPARRAALLDPIVVLRRE